MYTIIQVTKKYNLIEIFEDFKTYKIERNALKTPHQILSSCQMYIPLSY